MTLRYSYETWLKYWKDRARSALKRIAELEAAAAPGGSAHIPCRQMRAKLGEAMGIYKPTMSRLPTDEELIFAFSQVCRERDAARHPTIQDILQQVADSDGEGLTSDVYYNWVDAGKPGLVEDLGVWTEEEVARVFERQKKYDELFNAPPLDTCPCSKGVPYRCNIVHEDEE